MRIRNRILELERANRLTYASVPLPHDDVRRLSGLFPDVLRRIADPNIFEFVWQHSGIRVDEDYLVHYPVVEEWEWKEAMTCPVPHPHIWIETAALGPEPSSNRYYIWDVVEGSGHEFSATPLVFDGQTNSLSYFGTYIAVDRNEIDELGRRGTVKVFNALTRYASDYEMDEFYAHANMIARFLRMLCLPKVVIESEPSDQRANRERRRRGRETISPRHTVRISEDAFKYQNGNILHGAHTSPREHYRRAHKRRYADGSDIEVRGCVVNEGRGSSAATPQYFTVD